MSEETIIRIIDVLAEKMGILVDYSRENIIPYARDLTERYIDYIIINDIIYIIMILGFNLCFIYGLIKFNRLVKGKEKDIIKSDMEAQTDAMMALFIVVLIIFGLQLIIAVGFLLYNVQELIAAFLIPEKLIYDLLANTI